MLALIDADIVLHRVGYTTNDDPEWIAKARVSEMVEGILLDTQASNYNLWLSDSRENNFRTHLWAGYKANRTQPRPVHYDYIKEFLITEWEARIAHGMEADDALGINQNTTEEDHWTGNNKWHTVICSIDKDLMQIPGLHYNFVKKEWNEVTPEEGEKDFYKSILIGDATDNIKGCRGIGPIKADKAFIGYNNPLDYFDTVFKLFLQQEVEKSTEEILQHILLAGRLLKIRTEEDEKLWSFPLSSQIKAIFA